MNNLDRSYKELLNDIITNGIQKADRTGTGTKSIFGRQIRHKMSEGFPLLTTKKMAYKAILTELLWFLRGDTNIKFLLDNNCHIWDGDAYKNYTKHASENSATYNYWMCQNPDRSFRMWTREEFFEKIINDSQFADVWGDLGPIYGAQWRSWKDYSEGSCRAIDQIANAIKDLQNNPDSRRIMVNAWNVAEIENAVLPPCFTGNMLVKCADGHRKISEIQKDDLVLTEDGSYQKVYNLYETNYNSKILHLKVYGNTKIIEATPNHPFLVKGKGYIEAKNITKEDYLGIPINKNSIIPKFKCIINSKEIETILDNPDYWYLMGYFLGDGWLVDSKDEIYFSVNDLQEKEVIPILQKIIGLAKLTNSGKNCKKYVGRKRQVFEILELFGKYAHGKKIPQFIHDAPIHLIKSFIDGYQKADGCLTKDGISYTTVSESIAYDLQLLYAKLKIKAIVYYQKRKKRTVIENREVNQMDTYSINVYKQKNKSATYIFDENYLWLKVKDIQEADFNGFVYNMSVAGNHTYNVYNLVNHNCHYGFQLYTRELNYKERLRIWFNNNYETGFEFDETKIVEFDDPYWMPTPKRALSLMFNMRSIDVPLGLPFNIASYATLLIIFGEIVSMQPDELIVNLGDAHIYNNQFDGIKEQLTREPFDLPHLILSDRLQTICKKFRGEQTDNITAKDYGYFQEVNGVIDSILVSDFELKNYNSHASIKIPLSN